MPGNHSAPGAPQRPDSDTHQDRQHQRFHIGFPGEMLFGQLQNAGQEGNAYA